MEYWKEKTPYEIKMERKAREAAIRNYWKHRGTAIAWGVALIGIGLLTGFASYLFALRQADTAEKNAEITVEQPIQNPEVHIHADFKVYLNGKAYDFSEIKYQSTEEHKLSESVHLHDKNGRVMHIHNNGATLRDFFSSLGIELIEKCLTLDTGQKFCNKNGKTLKFFVNGQVNVDFERYQMKDLDKILISFGEDTDATIAKQITFITSEACIYSKKCPAPKGFKDTE